MITSVKKIAHLSSHISELTNRVKVSQQVFRLYPVNSALRRTLVRVTNRVGMYDALALLILNQYNSLDKLKKLYESLNGKEVSHKSVKDYYPLLNEYNEDELLEMDIQTSSFGKVKYNEYPGILVRSFTYKPVKRVNPTVAVCTKMPDSVNPEVIYIVPEKLKIPDKYNSVQVVTDDLEFIAGYLDIIIDGGPKTVNALLSLDNMQLSIELGEYEPGQIYMKYLVESCSDRSEYKALVAKKRLAVIKTNRTKILELPDDIRYDLLREQINNYKTSVLHGDEVIKFAPGELIKDDDFTTIYLNQFKKVLTYLISYEEERSNTVHIYRGKFNLRDNFV